MEGKLLIFLQGQPFVAPTFPEPAKVSKVSKENQKTVNFVDELDLPEPIAINHKSSLAQRGHLDSNHNLDLSYHIGKGSKIGENLKRVFNSNHCHSLKLVLLFLNPCMQGFKLITILSLQFLTLTLTNQKFIQRLRCSNFLSLSWNKNRIFLNLYEFFFFNSTLYNHKIYQF